MCAYPYIFSIQRSNILIVYFVTADAINNAAGFGFRGYDRNGVARWDLISNLRIQQIEVSKR